MPFADLNGTESSGCAASTGVSAGHIGETALLRGKQRHDRRDCFLYFHNEFYEVRTPLFNIETSHRESSIRMEADRAFITRHLKRTDSCRHRRTSTPGGSERGEDPALPAAGGSG
ncbi:hypothetical protein [Alkalicoccus luteus]|uniref:hypothetical protein n=1 Tax=Alkalicoccus luteus TaxID=1237094 RepID=UPI00143BDFBB|nr:hypothetical protein [Alkalicoccus luteus]